MNFKIIQDTLADFTWSNCRFIREYRFFFERNKYDEEISILEITFEYMGNKNYLIKAQFKELGNYEINSGGSKIQLIFFASSGYSRRRME